MDEQMTAVSAEATSSEEGYTPEVTDASLPEGAEPEISVNEEGEVQFRDDFFGDVPDEPEPEPEAPKYYTMDELTNTPYEQWDINRMPEQMRDYANIVRSQLEQRRTQEQLRSRPREVPNMEIPHAYTPKELAEEAQKLAIEKLGLEDADDFDDYEPEHRAALQMAMNELSQRNSADVARYQRASGEYQQLQEFNAYLAGRPDWKEFDQWFAGRMKAEGLTPQQVNMALNEAVNRDGGGHWSAVQNALTQWYREFQGSKQGGRVKRPPRLESSGTGYDTRGSVNMRDFGNMDIDRQAQALMKMGIV